MSRANLDISQKSLTMFPVGNDKNSVQFEITDPELAAKLLQLAAKLKMRGDIPRASFGGAGRELLLAILRAGNLGDELLGFAEPPPKAVSEPPARKQAVARSRK